MGAALSGAAAPHYIRPLTVTDPLSHTVLTNTYDSFGQLSTSADALSHTTTLGYDSNGNLLNTGIPRFIDVGGWPTSRPLVVLAAQHVEAAPGFDFQPCDSLAAPWPGSCDFSRMRRSTFRNLHSKLRTSGVNLRIHNIVTQRSDGSDSRYVSFLIYNQLRSTTQWQTSTRSQTLPMWRQSVSFGIRNSIARILRRPREGP